MLARGAHVHAQAGADLVLDTPRYNGVATSVDNLWARVPVLTLPTGARVGRSVSVCTRVCSCLHACVRGCVRACACVCVRACVHAGW